MRLPRMAVGLVVALAAPANALSLPSDGSLNFEVVRNGKDIGDHSYRFSGSKGAFSVKVATDVVVKVPLIRITAYSFKHSSVETWKDGKLSQISSVTDEGGEPHQLKTANKGPLPASFWNDDLLQRQGRL